MNYEMTFPAQRNQVGRVAVLLVLVYVMNVEGLVGLLLSAHLTSIPIAFPDAALESVRPINGIRLKRPPTVPVVVTLSTVGSTYLLSSCLVEAFAAT